MSTIPQPTAGATGRIARASVLVDLAAPLDRSPPSQTSMSLAVAASSAVAARVSAKTSASVRGGNLRRSARVPARRVMASAARAEVNILKDEDKKSLVDSVETFIFDCDGVIWKGDSLIEGVPETIAMLRAMGKRLIFVTNNSTKSRAGYLKKFLGLGLEITAEEVFSSSFAAAAYLESIDFPKDKKVYVVGETGILEELDGVGISHLGGEADKGKEVTLASGQLMEHDPDVGAVIVGFDRNVNYYKIQYATLCIRENPGCMFIATNTDAVTHLTDAQEWAGNGSMVGAIKGAPSGSPPWWASPRRSCSITSRTSSTFARTRSAWWAIASTPTSSSGRTEGFARCWCSPG